MQTRLPGIVNPESKSSAPWACLLGDISMVRALGIRGIPVALATADRSDKSTRSRYCRDVIDIPGWHLDPERTVSSLTEWAGQHASPPVLFYQTDMDVLWISRFRDRLASHFRFVLPDAEMVEDLVDKARFYDRAIECGIPIPETRIIDSHRPVAEQCADWKTFPCVIKPIIRTTVWHRNVIEGKKALNIDSEEELQRALDTLHGESGPLILQACVRGGEENVLSYHAYVRENLDIAMEFTGAKIRTYPREYGSSCYLEVTADDDIRDLGRQVVAKLGYQGVLKIDFKRDEATGRVYVLEINPRFNLWHHPGTKAGLPIPEAVYRDFATPGQVRKTRRFRPGVRWMRPRKDILSYREYQRAGELSAVRWLYQVLTVDVNEGFQLLDPGPTIHDVFELFQGRNNSAKAVSDKSCKLR